MLRGLLLGALALVLCADKCHDDGSDKGRSQINGQITFAPGGEDDIRVRAVGRDTSTRTDSSGTFSLEDRIAGPTTLLLERSDGLSSDLDLPPFPRGSVVTLDDIHVPFFVSRASYGAASVSFSGRVAEVDCADRTIWVFGEVEPADGEFPVRTDDARISDRRDRVINCSAVRVGDSVDVSGRLGPTGGITHASVVDRSL